MARCSAIFLIAILAAFLLASPADAQRMGGGMHGGGMPGGGWHGGGGGMHGSGGWHGGGGSWHGGGWHGGGWGGWHGGWHGGGWPGGGWGGGVFVGVSPWWGWGPYWGGGWAPYAYPYYSYPHYGYPDYPGAYPGYPPGYYQQGTLYADPPVEDAAPLDDHATTSSNEGYWYYCPSAHGYYPKVPKCREAWVKVPPRWSSTYRSEETR
jgi:hypothetical protein